MAERLSSTPPSEFEKNTKKLAGLALIGAIGAWALRFSTPAAVLFLTAVLAYGASKLGKS